MDNENKEKLKQEEGCKCPEQAPVLEALTKPQIWRHQFIENYEGRSFEAKSVEPFIKKNYKGNKYLPWAMMERLTYMQDPEAVFETLPCAESRFGNTVGLVHTQTEENVTIIDGKETRITMFSHFVKVSCTFLGKTVIEDYPIQDKAYDAPKMYDSNLVNKAIQRAKAKVASRVTGIGLKLYEGADLQFEDDKDVSTLVTKEDTPNQSTQEKKTFIPKDDPMKSTQDNPDPKPNSPTSITKPVVDELLKIAQFMHKNKDIENAVKVLNTSVQAKSGFTFNLDETPQEIAEKLSKIANAKTFITAICTKAKVANPFAGA